MPPVLRADNEQHFLSATVGKSEMGMGKSSAWRSFHKTRGDASLLDSSFASEYFRSQLRIKIRLDHADSCFGGISVSYYYFHSASDMII